MCQRCIKRSKNLGQPRTVKPGLIRVLARQFMAGRSIPVFAERAANFAIEAEMERMRRQRTKRGKYDNVKS